MLRNYSEAAHPVIYGTTHQLIVANEKLRHHLKVVGRENVPANIGAVLVASHRDGHDPIAAAAAMSRPIHFMAKEELWTEEYDFIIPLVNKTLNLGGIVELLGAFPVKRGSAQISTIRRALQIAKNGGVVGIFPEMTRYEDEEQKIVRGQRLGHLNAGAAAIALSQGVPLVPMGIGVSREIDKKGKSRVVRVAAIIKECVEPTRNPEVSKKQEAHALMEAVRPILQEAHDEARELVA